MKIRKEIIFILSTVALLAAISALINVRTDQCQQKFNQAMQLYQSLHSATIRTIVDPRAPFAPPDFWQCLGLKKYTYPNF